MTHQTSHDSPATNGSRDPDQTTRTEAPSPNAPSIAALVVPADIDTPMRRIGVSGLADLQAAVGGNIEALPYHGDDAVTAYGDEEAKLVDEPEMNARATRLLGPGLFAGDFIAGDIVVCGWDHEAGENLDCPQAFEEIIEQAHRDLRDPDRRTIRSRTVSYEWDLFEDDEQKRTMAVLSIMHDTAGAHVLSGRQHGNEFAAILSNETVQPRSSGIVARGFLVRQGIRLGTQPVSRYSEKRRDTFAAAMLELLHRAYAESNPQVTRYFRLQNGGAL
jgi:hypothetical protein